MISPMLISGKQGSGKSTIAGILTQLAIRDDFIPKVVKFAAPLYELHNACLPILKELGIRPQEMAKDGDLLQVLGSEYGRHKIRDTVWIECAIRTTRKWLETSDKHLVIIDDLRFENEFDAFIECFRVRLTCPEYRRKERCSYWREDTTHPSEVGLDAYEEQARFDLKWSTECARSEVCAEGIWDAFKKKAKL